ncbi:hypothetical protein BOTBODRAFT_33102 [Botryobasidium botryosum FD-172 SS1]|uniref:Serine aminopeptidase S33 domain-containing protein n=1 Tax=Botryobasidium botryosum (strain FD-172 SS1) TaxID=930990 RepID=A0A067MH02_BOTB1|nr:hypothetical protein BOTBODRAFT_33102 [Botryobasidium botryosum FD-172 SS1]
MAEIFLVPLLNNLNLYTPTDPTYGRYLLPQSPAELELERDPAVKVRSRRVFVNYTGDGTGKGDWGEDVQLSAREVETGVGKEWLFYKVWECDGDVRRGEVGDGCDLVMIHGLDCYGGKYAPHVRRFLDLGYRIIIPDLPSHGRSTGVHSHIDSANQLSDAVYHVLKDRETWSPKTRKTFLIGSSMGGWTCLSYCLRYPSDQYFPIDGVFAIAPLIGVAPETLPHPITIQVARVLRFFAGRLPLSPGVKGNLHSDPIVEEESDADPLGYHGHLRVATGLALLEGFTTVGHQAHLWTHPLRIIHGSHDRSTSHTHSVDWFERAGGCDKQCEIYEGYEHVMLKVGVDEADDEERQRVLRDMELWLGERAKLS